MGSSRRRGAGFSLLEMMITVTIIGILVAIVYPNYQDYVFDSRRTDGTAVLMEAAQRLERCYASSMAYDEDDDGACDDATDDIDGMGSPEGYYAVNIVTADLTATTYTLQAIPQDVQAADECGTLTLDQAGVQGVSGQDTGITAADCW